MLDKAMKLLFKSGDMLHPYIIQITVDGSIDYHDLLRNRQGGVLALFEDFGDSSTSVDPGLGGLIQIGAELGKGL